jgi:hypothetical protein
MKVERFDRVSKALRYIDALEKKKRRGFLSSRVLKESKTKPWKIEWLVSYKKG